MGEWQYIRTQAEDKVAVLTIDHPPVNSFNKQVVTELGEAIDELLADDAVKVIIITGGGTNAFVAGADIPEIKELIETPEDDYAAAATFIERGQGLFLKIEQAPKPIIAAINGFCLGGGLELAMSCHMRICSDRARLGQPEINLGIIPGYGGTQRLPRLVGKGRAKWLILTGDMISAQEALRIGLVDFVVPADELMDAARKLARKIASKAPLAVAWAKKCVNVGTETDLVTACAYEAGQFGLTCGTEDRLEGTTAFLEKRPPRFKGQ